VKEKGIRHAVLCNEMGQILTGGVVFEVATERGTIGFHAFSTEG